MKKLIVFLIVATLSLPVLVGCELPFDLPFLGGKDEVTFSLDGEVYATAAPNDDGSITLPTDPEKEGFEFRGWFNENDERWYPDTYTGGEINVHAKFKAIEYSIKYTDPLKVSNPNPRSYTADDGAVIEPLTKDGYDFVGWFLDRGGKEAFSGVIEKGATGDLQLFAKWNLKTYSATFMVEGVKVGEAEFNVSQDKLDEPAIPEKLGYSGSWSYEIKAENITATAVYTPVQYKIEYVGLFGAVNAYNPATYTIETESFELKAPTTNTDSFLGWYLERECINPASVSILKGSTGDITVYAKWNCDHDFVGTVKVKPLAFKEGVMEYNCKNCLQSYEEKIKATGTVKLLAIGNSFSQDALQHLGGILVDLGVEEIVIMNLYIGGCTLDRHWNNMSTGGTEYTLYSFDRASLTMKTVDKAANVEDTLALEDWDIVTLQQQSGNSGKPESFGNLQNIINFIRAREPKADLYWHMTWAYQEGDSRFGTNYGNSQVTMFEAIASTVNNVVLPTGAFVGVIPSGTAIQNMRTGSLGDNLNRDGLHLSYGAGRYTAALTWAAVLTGGDIDTVTWTPENYPDVAAVLAEIKEAVKAAVAKPYEITELK